MNMKRRPANLHDVARLAHVSIATVSRTLSRPDLVKESTLHRVREAVDKLGYVVQGAGRALSLRHTHTIGAIFPSLNEGIFANTASALQKTLSENQYMLLLACSEFSFREELKLTRMLLERGVDGIVFVGLEHDPTIFHLIDSSHVPYVFTWAFDYARRFFCVGFNDRRAGSIMAEHVVGLGHREIGIITAYTRRNERQRERLAGMRQVLDGHGIALPPERIIEVRFSFQAGRDGARELFRRDSPPTAIICSNDVMAVGAMAECHEMGLSVPSDISISGFENQGISSNVVPQLTTVGWSGHDLGRVAAEMLLSRIAGLPTAMQVEVPVELIVRGTTASLRLQQPEKRRSKSRVTNFPRAGRVAV